MGYDKKKVEMEEAANKMGKALIGKKVVSVEMSIGRPGHYTSVIIVMEDGTSLEVTEGSSFGCFECDPEGNGSGVGVEVREKK